MEIIILSILVVLVVIALIAEYKIYQNRKSKPPRTSQNKEINIEEITELEKYNAIITLSNQIQINNILLFLILLILFITLVLPLIITGVGINQIINTINTILNAST